MRAELVTTLKRQATTLLFELERNKGPLLMTQHGAPNAYVVEGGTDETVQHWMRLFQEIARGEKAVEEGRTLTHAQAKKRMNRWLK